MMTSESTPKTPPTLFLLAVDLKTMRPGKPIIQAVLGGDYDLVHRFPKASWLDELTADMQLYELTEAQLTTLIRRVIKQFPAEES